VSGVAPRPSPGIALLLPQLVRADTLYD